MNGLLPPTLKLLPAFAIFLSFALAPVSSSADNFDLREYSLKAVFIERFTRFIEWPDEKSPNGQLNPFVLCVADNARLYKLLKEIYQTQKIQNRQVIVGRHDEVENLENCHLLYISEQQNRGLDELLEQTDGHPVLTIADTTGYARHGVMINFFMSHDNKIRFEINEQAIKKSGLYVSYKLLSVAKIVEVN